MIYWLKKYFSNPSGHGAAILEVAMTAAFAIAPFLITFFVRYSRSADAVVPSLDDLLGRGQLYLLSYGVFGSVFWIAFMRADRPRHGARVVLGAIALLLIFPVVGFIGVDPTFSTVLNRDVVRLSYWFYAILLFINYLLLFYIDIAPPEPRDVLSRETGEMRRAYEDFKK